jgi:hypothetical protein
LAADAKKKYTETARKAFIKAKVRGSASQCPRFTRAVAVLYSFLLNSLSSRWGTRVLRSPPVQLYFDMGLRWHPKRRRISSMSTCGAIR